MISMLVPKAGFGPVLEIIRKIGTAYQSDSHGETLRDMARHFVAEQRVHHMASKPEEHIFSMFRRAHFWPGSWTFLWCIHFFPHGQQDPLRLVEGRDRYHLLLGA